MHDSIYKCGNNGKKHLAILVIFAIVVLTILATVALYYLELQDIIAVVVFFIEAYVLMLYAIFLNNLLLLVFVFNHMYSTGCAWYLEYRINFLENG